jgi:hypothetical protein
LFNHSGSSADDIFPLLWQKGDPREALPEPLEVAALVEHLVDNLLCPAPTGLRKCISVTKERGKNTRE